MKTTSFFMIIFSVFLRTEQVRAINRGLINCGNSCYMNASTQCFSHITPLSEYLKKNEPTFMHDEESDGIVQYIDLLKDLQVPTEEQIASEGPLDIDSETNHFHHTIINRIANWWELDEQQDAPEYLEYFLNYLISKDPNPDFIKQLFLIQNHSKVMCASGHLSEHAASPDFILKISIPEMPNTSIESCIAKYFEEEQLTDENQYQCNTCALDDWRKKENIVATRQISIEDIPYEERNKKVDATKQVSIEDSPPYLIIALNRFKNIKQEIEVKSEQTDEDGNIITDDEGLPITVTEKQIFYIQEKITQPVPFNQNLTLASHLFLDQSMSTAHYSLIGFVVHQGPYGGGHYWAYAKDPTDNTWRKFDDDSVSNAEPDVQKISAAGIEKIDIQSDSESEEGESTSELDGTPYIFFYVRDHLPAELNDYLIPTFEDPLAKKLRSLKSRLMTLKNRLTALKDKLEELKQNLGA